MKRIALFVLAAVLAPVLVWPGDVISPEQAAGYVGKKVTVTGEVVDAKYAFASNGRPTFLNFGGRYPNHTFTVVIWGQDRSKFPLPPEEMFLGKVVTVTGTVQRYRGKPEMVVSSPTAIAVVGGSGAKRE